MGKVALAVALSGKIRDKELIIVGKLTLKDIKTKEMAKVLSNFKFKGKTLIAFSDSEKKLQRASQNLKTVKNTPVSQINILDLLNNKNLFLSKESLKYLENKYQQ